MNQCIAGGVPRPQAVPSSLHPPVCVCIVAAAGRGARMGAPVNKVLLPLRGESVLLRTLRQLSRCGDIDSLLVVAGTDDMDLVRTLLAEASASLKPWRLVAGGKERQDSIRNALAALGDDCGLVLVHDAARPLIDPGTVHRLVAATREHGAAIVAVPVKDTIKRVAADGIIADTLERATLWQAQTPQGFRRDLLAEAYARAGRCGITATDDAALVEQLGVAVRVVRGDYRNLKLTTPEDLLLAEALQGDESP